MNKDAQIIIKNIVYILILDLVMLPFGVFVFLQAGWHIYHLALILGYGFGVAKIVETAHLLIKYVRFVDPETEHVVEDEDLEHVSDSVRYGSEPLKPAMKKAIDEVFFNRKS